MRGRPGSGRMPPGRDKFQSTPPCGGDALARNACYNIVKFQSTPPCGGDRSGSTQKPRSRHFNPRPHAGATSGSTWKLYRNPISIHAPMRGRLSAAALSASIALFQSTPPCGGDGKVKQPVQPQLNFNPRPHAGATDHCPEDYRDGYISIHAPMRGRPLELSLLVVRAHISIHAPMRGRHHPRGCHHGGFVISIHAPMRGRLKFIPSRNTGVNFNPRPHAGATPYSIIPILIFRISIHAPMRGRHDFGR